MATESETTPVDIGLDDAALFDEAIADTPAETPAAEAQPEQTEAAQQARDEQGRFAAAKTEETAAKTDPEPAAEQRQEQEEDKHGQIPSWRLREEREARAEAQKRADAAAERAAKLEGEMEALRRQFQTMQTPKQPAAEAPKEQRPDPLIDPEGYERYMENKFEQRFLNERREMSLSLAHRTHGKDFEEAFASAQETLAKGDPALAAKLQQSRDPGETLMAWHREQKVMREVGSDPNAWLQKKLEEKLSDPAFLAQAIERAKGTAQTASTQTQRPNVQLPPSLASMSRAEGSRGASADHTDLSDEGLFNYAIR